MITERHRKIADICAALSKRYDDGEIVARPYPTDHVTSGWAFYPPDEDATAFKLGLRDIDNEDVVVLVDRLELAFKANGFPPPNLLVAATKRVDQHREAEPKAVGGYLGPRGETLVEFDGDGAVIFGRGDPEFEAIAHSLKNGLQS